MSASDEKSAADFCCCCCYSRGRHRRCCFYCYCCCCCATCISKAEHFHMVFNAFGSNFLSFFLSSTFFSSLVPILFDGWGIFFYSILFSLIPFYSIELIQTPTCNSKWIVYVFVWISSHKWRATCDLLSLNLYICCVGVCVIEQHNIDFRYTHTHKHETRIHACTYDILATIYAEKEVKIII